MDRRGFLQAGAIGAGAVVLGPLVGCAPPTVPPSGVFAHGVASGLHGPDAAVLWTRVEPTLSDAREVTWSLSTTPDMTSIVASGVAAVSADADHCVKVLAEGLSPSTRYWYRFTAGDTESPIGRTATTPAIGEHVEQLDLAMTSCQHYSQGFYAAWSQVAATDLDAVLFLGDYIYEQGMGPLGVRWEPFTVAETLEDYRAKYRLYRSDPALQAAHAAHPWLIVWDDHELWNNHDAQAIADESTRAAAAYQAWFEYQPVWPIDGTRIHRSIRWGDLAEIPLLDTRQYRSPHEPSGLVVSALDEVHADPARSILGGDQRDWLLDVLDDASTDAVRWKLLGNQVMMMPLRLADFDEPDVQEQFGPLPKHAGLYSSFDGWDGFPVERDLILGHVADQRIEDLVVLTGDYHAFFQGRLRADFDDAASPIVAHEFVISSISSSTVNATEQIAAALGGGQLATYPRFDHVDLDHNGYGTLHATHDALSVTYHRHHATTMAPPLPAAHFDLPAGATPSLTTRS